MKAPSVVAVLLGTLVGVLLFLVTWAKPINTPAPPPTPKINTIVPMRIRIPMIQVDTVVEHVGTDAKGSMDIPKNVMNSAWYEPGYKPGAIGSAVIAAHFDTPTGAPGPFYNIERLVAGDTIEIEDQNGKTLTFVVVNQEEHSDASFPIQEVFAQNDKPRLNLITCSGTWDETAKNYSSRLVIYAVLAEQNATSR